MAVPNGLAFEAPLSTEIVVSAEVPVQRPGSTAGYGPDRRRRLIEFRQM